MTVVGAAGVSGVPVPRLVEAETKTGRVPAQIQCPLERVTIVPGQRRGMALRARSATHNHVQLVRNDFMAKLI